jgi:hypothetical protein
MKEASVGEAILGFLKALESASLDRGVQRRFSFVMKSL